MQYSSIVVLTGAGVSAESGLQTFRDNNGLWQNHRFENLATPAAFADNPGLVNGFYNQRRKQLLSTDVKPNMAHISLAEFAASTAARMLLVTQNVDNLHEKAGSKQVLHMHGELLSARCVNSGISLRYEQDIDESAVCQCCSPASRLRPDIVWFGEMPMYMRQIEQALSDCDLFIAIGTSGHVYPAAGFVSVARAAGAHTVELNLAPSHGQNYFAEHHYGPASDIVPRFFQSLVK